MNIIIHLLLNQFDNIQKKLEDTSEDLGEIFHQNVKVIAELTLSRKV